MPTTLNRGCHNALDQGRSGRPPVGTEVEARELEAGHIDAAHERPRR